MHRKKAQIWTIDLIAGITIFSIMMVIYFIFTANLTNYNRSDFNEIYNDANTISATLMSAGSPLNWTSDYVTEVGITNGDYRLNSSKLNDLSALGYSNLKLLLKTKYEYIIFFENRTGGLQQIEGIGYIGKSGITKDNIKQAEDPETLISVRRLLVHDDDIISMVIYVWE